MDLLLPMLIPFLLFILPVGSVIGFITFLVLFIQRRSMNKMLPVEMQKSTRGLKVGFIICGAIALTIIALFIVLVVLIDTGAIRLM